MTKAATTSALERFAEARAAVREAQRRADELAAQRNRPERAVRAVEARVGDAYAEAERDGGEPKARDVAALAAELAKVRAEAEVERVARQGQAEGAARALEARRSEVSVFAREHRGELIAELTARALEDRDELFAAVDALRGTRWGETSALARELCELWGESPADVPPNPLGGDLSSELDRMLAPFAGGQLRDPRRFLPVPSPWLPEEGPG